MKRIFILLLCGLFVSTTTHASDWEKSLDLGITVNHSKSKTNATGNMADTQNVTLGFVIDGMWEKDTEFINWKNSLNLDYAKSKASKRTGTVGIGSTWVEDIDQLTIDSVRMWKRHNLTSLYVAGNIQTSILDTTDSDNWESFRPVQVRESGGMGFIFVDGEKEDLTGRLGAFYQHYINKPDAGIYDNSAGLEMVVDYFKAFTEITKLKSKLGIYGDLVDTYAPWDISMKTKKVRFEFDNSFTSQLMKNIKLRLSFNVDNIDITDNNVNYEWEEKIDLIFSRKIF